MLLLGASADVNFADNLFAKVTTALGWKKKLRKNVGAIKIIWLLKRENERGTQKTFPLRSDAPTRGNRGEAASALRIFFQKKFRRCGYERGGKRHSLSDVGNQTKMTLKCFDESRRHNSTNPASISTWREESAD